MRKSVIGRIGITALLCLQIGHALGSILTPSPEDMTITMRKVGKILAQPALVPIPKIISSSIIFEENISYIHFAESAGVVLLRSPQKTNLIDLGTMKLIFSEQSSQLMPGSLSPNGRLFITNDNGQLRIKEASSGTLIAEIPAVLPWNFHWLDERTAFYVDRNNKSYFIDFVSGQTISTGLMNTVLAQTALIPDASNQYLILTGNKLFKFELKRNNSMPVLKLLAEKSLSLPGLASNTSGSTSDGKYFFNTASHLTLINLRSLEIEEISLEPFYFQTGMVAPTPDNIVVTGFIQPHDGSVPQDYLYSISKRSLAQIKPDKQSSSLRRIYISPFRKLGIISGKQIALMGVPQTAENTPVADFFSKVVSKSEQNKIKIAEKQQALEDSCHPPKEKNKDGIELHAIGIYEGPLQRSNDPSNKVDIKVYASEHPIVLALLSYESATWNITLDKGATLKEIILKTSDGIRVSGANSKAVKVTRQNIGSTAYKDCDFFRMVAPRLKEFSGLNVTSFQGAYSGIGFPVRPQQQVGETAIKVQALTSKPITTVYVGLDEGLDAYSRGDYRAALEKLMPLAETGIAMAQNTVGKMYLSGQGVPKDYNKAMLLFQKAAKQQLANAQNNIGVIYAGGYGVPQDFNRAIVWFEMAANRGFVNAMLNLADIYEEGVVVRKNPIAAEMWRHRAQGLPSHEEKGTVTVELSGSEEYRKGLDLYHNFRFREAFCHFLPAAINGHPEAQLNLASIYRNGQGGEKDEHLAQRWAEKGKARIEELAQATNSGVRNLVGSKDFNEGLVLYRNGKERESFCFFLKAAELNHPDAQMKLALMYQDGVGGRKDERQAQYWYKKAANKGYSSNDGRDRVYMLDAESTEAPIPPAAPKACGCTAEVPIDRCCK